MASAEMPEVAFIGTGGTISSIGIDSMDLARYVDNKKLHDIGGLLAEVPEVQRYVRVHEVPFRAIPSTAVGPAEWIELRNVISELLASRPALAGVVVTHGTASLEETAYFLHLTLDSDKPVVIVGAQRPATGLSTDAYLNLVNAARTAAAAEARGRGTLVVLNDEVHAAREVTKTSTLRLQTFRSPDFGALGHADPDKVAFYRNTTRRHSRQSAFAAMNYADLPRVDIIYTYGGADGALINAAVAAGAKGLVAAGFAPGYVTDAQLQAYEAAIAKGVQVAISSRVGSGRVVPVDALRPAGHLLADNLTPQKARVLLMLGLAASNDPIQLQNYFDQH